METAIALARIAAGRGNSGITRAVAEWTDEDTDTQSVNVTASEYRSTSKSGPDGCEQGFEGSRPQNEDDVLDACRLLREALNAGGEAFEPFVKVCPRDHPELEHVDARSTNAAGDELHVQVTRVVEQDVWKKLHLFGTAPQRYEIVTLARQMVTAATHKKYTVEERAELLLALDATRSPAHIHKQVVNLVVQQARPLLEALGYRAVWLVGPTVPHCYRLA